MRVIGRGVCEACSIEMEKACFFVYTLLKWICYADMLNISVGGVRKFGGYEAWEELSEYKNVKEDAYVGR